MNQILESLYQGDHLDRQQTEKLITRIVQGQLTEIEISALLVALKFKGESSDEIAGAASALRASATPFPQVQGTVVDTCGTGGDGLGTINISTIVGLVAAECGVKVAKHGNRSVSSKSGSSDVLQRFGVKLDVTPDVAARCLEQENFCFLFAPLYHPGVKHVMPVRTALKTRTLFNLIGPLANPAAPNVQLMGVYDPKLLVTMAKALQQLGCQKAMVVNGGGLDEIALHCPTNVAFLNNGEITEEVITPEQAGLEQAPLSRLQIDDPEAIAAALLCVVKGVGQREHNDVVALNTAAVLLLADKVANLAEGVKVAQEAILSGRVAQRLARIAELTNGG
ncbi:anthranilate phosphoribosyltransferase [Pleionea litopenaei]|uniref:Anthranilate phosphoribosyltransferase n=1 Tax=Pleionea litopenaei TaxID=3070815 RepID=A0AA51X7R9_9GAMM|nr:anthranilate phosphoribosyltransferase [Pleionea sp. HL-JVS1]WMS87400.1 anthranilate phosphoribosyltransferase [Pleionea sp. HL-JVS1]